MLRKGLKYNFKKKQRGANPERSEPDFMNNVKFLYRSSTKDALSSERLDEGARPVFSKQLGKNSNVQTKFRQLCLKKYSLVFSTGM